MSEFGDQHLGEENQADGLLAAGPDADTGAAVDAVPEASPAGQTTHRPVALYRKLALLTDMGYPTGLGPWY